MSLTALGLIFVAAFLHAGWNLVVKQADYKQIFLWWALLLGATGFACVFLPQLLLPFWIWPYVISSAIMEAGYVITLTWAYEIDDFSLIYPIARGSAPVFLVCWSTFFLGEPPRPGGLIGIIVLVCGLIVVGGGPVWSRLSRTTMSIRGVVAALLCALCISLYTAIDGAAAHLVPVAPYTVIVLALSALLVGPVLFVRYGARLLVTQLRTSWLRIILVGIAMVLAYIIVLQAYTLARVSYAGAVREVSIVFAALFGWRWLKEGFGATRTVGALLIFCGIFIIAVLGS